MSLSKSGLFVFCLAVVLSIGGCSNPASISVDDLANTIVAQTIAAYTSTPTTTSTATDTPKPTATKQPTSTPTFPPTETSTPSATPLPPQQVAVGVDGLNVRTGPGMVYFVVGRVTRGDMLTVIGQAYDCAWLKVITPAEAEGWVSAEQLNAEISCDTLALAQIPPTPEIAQATTTPPRGQKVLVINNTGFEISLFLSGQYDYSFTIPPGRHQIFVVAGRYTYYAQCKSVTIAAGEGVVNPTWYFKFNKCGP